jgi:hypothetical protein
VGELSLRYLMRRPPYSYRNHCRSLLEASLGGSLVTLITKTSQLGQWVGQLWTLGYYPL